MTSRPDLVPPPRIATWLVSLFVLPEEESILGDLHEEFCDLASKSGVKFARRWYWRQSLTTIAHLFGTGFCAAPWSTSAAVVGGFVLGGFVHGLPDKVLSAVTDKYLTYWSAHFQAYLWVLKAILIEHFGLVDVRRLYRRVGGQGKRDGCHGDAEPCPFRVGCSCLFCIASRALAHGRSPLVDAIPMRWSIRNRYRRCHGANAQV